MRPWRLVGLLAVPDSNTIASKADILGSTSNPQSLPAAVGFGYPVSDAVVTARSAERCIFESGDGAGVLLKFAANGADNGTATFNIWSWEPIVAPGSTYAQSGVRWTDQVQWHAVLLASISTTLSTKVGIAGGILTASDRYVDTITISSNRGYSGQIEVVGPASADNQSVALKIDTINSSLLEVTLTANASDKDYKILAKTFTAQ